MMLTSIAVVFTLYIIFAILRTRMLVPFTPIQVVPVLYNCVIGA